MSHCSGLLDATLADYALLTRLLRTAVPHGPTSAFFDDITTPEPQSHLQYPSYSESDLVDRATAECGEQRHLEMVNLASGQLDCEFEAGCQAFDNTNNSYDTIPPAGDGVPPDLAVHLLALHWNRQHFAFLITYRPREL